jgi:hypothetical protein
MLPLLNTINRLVSCGEAICLLWARNWIWSVLWTKFRRPFIYGGGGKQYFVSKFPSVARSSFCSEENESEHVCIVRSGGARYSCDFFLLNGGQHKMVRSPLPKTIRSRDSVIGVVNRLGAVEPSSRGSIPVKRKKFILFPKLHIGSVVHTVVFSMGTAGSFAGAKGDEAWRWVLTRTRGLGEEWVEL